MKMTTPSADRLDIAILGPNPPPLRSGQVVRVGRFVWHVHRNEALAEFSRVTVHRSRWAARRALRLWIVFGRRVGKLA
jgi:hypothetical protein